MNRYLRLAMGLAPFVLIFIFLFTDVSIFLWLGWIAIGINVIAIAVDLFQFRFKFGHWPYGRGEKQTIICPACGAAVVCRGTPANAVKHAFKMHNAVVMTAEFYTLNEEGQPEPTISNRITTWTEDEL